MTSHAGSFGPPSGPFGPAGASNVPIDPSGIVTSDLTCRKCGYNLRGLSINGRCPECGSPVGLSAQGNLIRFSDPGWVNTLRRGAKMIIYGIATIVLAIIVGILLAMAIGTAGGVLAGIAAVAGYVMIMVGWWQLTEPDPSGVGEDEYGTSRKIIRVTLVLGVINQVLNLIVNAGPPPSVRVGIQILSFLIGIAGVVGIFAQLQYLKKLSLRIPDDSLASRAQFLMYGLGFGYAAVVVVGLVAGLMAGSGTVSPALGVLGCFGGIIGLVVLVLLIMYLRMIERLGKRFGEEAAVAEQTWARAEAGARAAPAPGAYPPSVPPVPPMA